MSTRSRTDGLPEHTAELPPMLPIWHHCLYLLTKKNSFVRCTKHGWPLYDHIHCSRPAVSQEWWIPDPVLLLETSPVWLFAQGVILAGVSLHNITHRCAFLRKPMNYGTRITGQLQQPTTSLHTWPTTSDIAGCLCLFKHYRPKHTPD